jgi:murein DD-endopeptidase MepM/ murein hydrolase activator NlpD
MKGRSWIPAALLILVAASLSLELSAPIIATAQAATSSTDDIQSQIDAQNAQITALNTQIAQYQSQLDATDAQKQTLQNQLNQISLSLKKTGTSITLSQKQITATSLEIRQLGSEITDKQASIQSDDAALADSIRSIDESDSVPLSIALLSDTNISGAWNDIDDTETIRDAFDAQAQTLKADQTALASSQSAAAAKQTQLVATKENLQTQQGSLAATKAAQTTLLTQTKSQESTYETIIAQKKAQETSFEEALTDLKAADNQTVTAGEITAAAPGVLAWPICPAIGGVAQWPTCGKETITQFFGDTGFADAHEALYSGHGHDGLDIATPIGTPVHAALTGTVIGFGNTDATPGCQGGSFGMWIMLRHDDGLNTMYAHLSKIDVTQGETVQTGDVIGYSGETGYATGPHLHFGVYVSSVTQIVPLGQITKGTAPCSKAVMPVPPVSGYLNPLNYLPSDPFKNDTGEPL